MNVIAKRTLREYYEQHADAKDALLLWHKIAIKAEWKSHNDMKQVFPSASIVGNYVVFNIKGNHYRLVVDINYERKSIYVLYIGTHAEYDKVNIKEL
jgi:mRNA interferase HigB